MIIVKSRSLCSLPKKIRNACKKTRVFMILSAVHTKGFLTRATGRPQGIARGLVSCLAAGPGRLPQMLRKMLPKMLWGCAGKGPGDRCSRGA